MLAWYDNERGYANRMLDLTRQVARLFRNQVNIPVTGCDPNKRVREEPASAKIRAMNKTPPHLTLIAAMAENRVIGRDNAMPWHLPADLAHFKRLTLGKSIIMGRRTWESLPGLLPHRSHIVITRDREYRAQGAMLAHSLAEALQIAGGDEAFIIGGAQLYAQALPLADRLLLTLVHAEITGDTRFPEFGGSEWRQVGCERHAADRRHPYDYSFCEWQRCSRPEPGPSGSNPESVTRSG